MATTHIRDFISPEVEEYATVDAALQRRDWLRENGHEEAFLNADDERMVVWDAVVNDFEQPICRAGTKMTTTERLTILNRVVRVEDALDSLIRGLIDRDAGYSIEAKEILARVVKLGNAFS